MLADGSEVSSFGSSSSDRAPTPLCEEMDAATRHLVAESRETIPVPHRLLEIAVRHHDEVRIDEDRPERRPPRPAGVTVVRRQIPEGIDGWAAGGLDDGTVYSQGAAGGWRYEVWAVPAAMPLDGLDHSAWLHRFQIDTVERRLGARPVEQPVGRDTLLVAYVATVPPATAEPFAMDGVAAAFTSDGGDRPSDVDEPTEGPATIDARALLDALVEHIGHAERPLLAAIEGFAAAPAAGLVSPGWLGVLCRSGGPAEYVVPPTRARERVTNGELFCAAAESRLGR